MFCLAQPSWAARFQKSAHTANRFGIRHAPGSKRYFDFTSGLEKAAPLGNWVPYLGTGGWVGVVPKTARDPDVAFSLLAFLGDPRVSQEIVIEPAWGGGVFRREHLTAPKA